MPPPGRSLSLEHKLPLLIGGLLSLVIAGFAWAAYGEVRRSALAAASERLARVTDDLRDLLAASAEQRLDDVRRAAAFPAVAAYLATPSAPAASRARDALAPLAQGDVVVAVELWTPAGTRLLTLGRSLPPIDTATVRRLIGAVRDTARAVIGPFRLVRDSLFYPVVARVGSSDRVQGYVVQRRRAAASPRAAQQLAQLIGSDAGLVIGNAAGDLWTNFVVRVPAPPVALDGRSGVVAYERPEGRRYLARATPVRGTPWLLVIEFPRDLVLAPVQAVLNRLALAALVLIGAGAAGAWVLSRRITVPLRRLTDAAEALAAGQPAAAVTLARTDELGRLARSFDAMARAVATARERLESAVVQRTRELEEATRRLEATSEERYRILFHHNPLPMWVYDQETLAFVDVNAAAERHYGYSREEFLRMTLKDIRPEEDLPRFLDSLPDSPGGLFEAGVWRHRRKDGSVIEVEVTRYRLELGGRRLGLVLAHDVTARLTAERALRESEEALRQLNVELEQRVRERTAELEAASRRLTDLAAIVESSQDAIYSKDLAGNILTWNPGAERLYGYTPAEIVGRPVSLLAPPEGQREVEAILARLRRGERVEHFETTRVRKDGTRVPISLTISPLRDAAGKVTGASAIARDVSDQKRAEEALRASEERFRALAHTAHDAIISADAHGRITYFNPAAERSFGYAEREVAGQALTVLMPPRFHDAHEKGLARYRATGEARVVGRTVELAGRRKDGTEFPLELSLAAWRSDNEPSFTGILRDITERKLAEEIQAEHTRAIARTNAELEAVNRELEAFSYSVSHDLRAPLRAIDGFSRILLEEHQAELGAEAQRLLGIVRKNTQRMGQLIDDLLTFSRLGRQALVAGAVDMGHLVRGVAEELGAEVTGRNIDWEIGALAPARGDRALLRQVWMNLLSNALKYSRPRPRARIDVGSRDEDGEIVYYVTDNGVGFDMNYADKLFGVFQRLHRTEDFEGTGVGLAIVQRIVHRHGGRVWAQGAVDRGATFCFTLPAAADRT